MNQISFNTKRIIVGIASIALLFCLINFYFQLNFFGTFDKIALVLSFVFLGVVMHFFGSTLKEIRG